MNQCIRCSGEGYQSYYDDGQYQEDTCYHCGGTGRVDDDTAFDDNLGRVANTLAYQRVTEMRNARNSDPDGEGWDFCAAENMLSGGDYFDLHVMDYADKYMVDLTKLPRESQELLIAWMDAR